MIDPHPPHRHKRFDQELMDRLESISGGDPGDVLIQAISGANVGYWKEILESSGLDEETATESLSKLLKEELVLEFGKKTKRIITLRSTWDSILTELKARVKKYHEDYPCARDGAGGTQEPIQIERHYLQASDRAAGRDG